MNEPDQDIDLVEAATVIGVARTGVQRPYSTLLRSLEPCLQRVAARLSGGGGDQEKIDALNEIALPAIQSKTGDFRWIHEAFGDKIGECVPNVLLYWIAADALRLRLQIVDLGNHFFLSYSAGGNRRNIEVTEKGQHLSVEEYRRFVEREIAIPMALPRKSDAFSKMLEPITKRQFVAVLLCQRRLERPRREVEQDCKEAMGIAPDSYHPLVTLVMHYSDENQLTKADDCATQAISVAPHVPAVYAQRGGLRILAKKPQAALEDIDAALTLAPHFAFYHVLRGAALESMSRFPAAVEAYTQAIQCDSNKASNWKTRARLLGSMKRYKEAIEDLSKAIQLDPNDPESFAVRAKLWAMVGDEKMYDADSRKAKELRNRH